MPDSFPVVDSSCIILKFAATHIDNVTFSSFTLALFALIMMRAPPVSPISCSSSGLANEFTLTRSGIERGFSPPLLAAALEVAGKVLLVAPSVSKGSSYSPTPSIFFILSSSPSSTPLMNTSLHLLNTFVAYKLRPWICNPCTNWYPRWWENTWNTSSCCYTFPF